MLADAYTELRSERLLAARDGDRLLRGWDRQDRHGHGRPRAGPFTAPAGCQPGRVRPRIRCCVPGRLLDVGCWPGAVVRRGGRRGGFELGREVAALIPG